MTAFTAQLGNVRSYIVDLIVPTILLFAALLAIGTGIGFLALLRVRGTALGFVTGKPASREANRSIRWIRGPTRPVWRRSAHLSSSSPEPRAIVVRPLALLP